MSRAILQPQLSVAGQDQRFARAFAVINGAIAARAFPGAAVAVVHAGRMVALRGFGRFTYADDARRVGAETMYDLASVSKVVATTAMAMLLYERGLLDLDVAVRAVVPEFADVADPRRDRVTVRMLLAHSSGLPAYARLFEQARSRETLLEAAYKLPLEADPGTRAEYSDIGFIILGEILARVAGEGPAENALSSFCRREVFGPLGMTKTLFRPAEQMCQQFPPTVEDLDFRHRVVQGEVDDENAWVMGGVAGHAGVFSSAGDVAHFAHVLLEGGSPLVRRETLELFTRRQASPAGTTRALGWDTPSRPVSQSGKYFSERAFGHLGYTGTSLWIDPERRLAVALLTNRTWPDRSSQAIKQVRPAFHDAVVEALA
ncbi:MAG TPA: serine hydrolase domain-containing protein [Terriglobales bacterium]|nr:serine hydrolase domain-containing protein [Terriglobales bacterium]